MRHFLLAILLVVCLPSVLAFSPSSLQRCGPCRRPKVWLSGRTSDEDLDMQEPDDDAVIAADGDNPAKPAIDLLQKGLDLIPGGDDQQRKDGNTTTTIGNNEQPTDVTQDVSKNVVEDEEDDQITTIIDPLLDMVTVPDWADSFFSQALPVGGKVGTTSLTDREEKGEEEVDRYPTSASDIIQKLQSLLSVVQRRTVRDLRWFDIMLLLKVSNDMREKYPEFREELYHDGASQDGISHDELKEICDAVTYARWAYAYGDDDTEDKTLDDLKRRMRDRSFVLLRDEVENTGFGLVGHYIAINAEEKVALIGLKGTSSFDDLITDAIGNAVSYTLDGPFSKSYRKEEVRCHEGMLAAALALADDIEELVRDLFLPAGYRIVLAGHSLGAGTSVLLGMILRSRIPSLRRRKSKSLHVYAIATPALLNFDAALACFPFVTSVVNNADVIPRLSITNLVNMGELLDMVDDRVEELKEQGIIEDGFHKALASFRNVMELEQFLVPEELERFLNEIHGTIGADDDECLYVPGRVAAIYEKGHTDREGHTESNDSSQKSSGEEQSSPKELDVVIGDGSMRMLRLVEVASTMLFDHRAKCYEDNIKLLLGQDPQRPKRKRKRQQQLLGNAKSKLKKVFGNGSR